MLYLAIILLLQFKKIFIILKTNYRKIQDFLHILKQIAETIFSDYDSCGHKLPGVFQINLSGLAAIIKCSTFATTIMKE